ncbi:ankyrin repeat-containing domain protein [Nemania sp. FL0031]|nr:ankyrin repeat-containing domain protein [Nemania sp. FL0031]
MAENHQKKHGAVKTFIRGQRYLHDAVIEKDINTINDLLNSGVKTERQNDQGDTPLTSACRLEHIDAIRALLNHNANIEHQNNQGDTPLTISCRLKQIDAIRALLDRGANTEHQNEEGDTPLTIACRLQHIDAIRALLDRKANTEHKNEQGDTPLTSACQLRHVDVIHALLDYNPNIEHRNKRGETSLTLACGLRYIDVMHALLNRNAKVNYKNGRGETPLTLACGLGYLDAMHALLNHNAEVNYQNEQGDTPLILACRLGYVDAMHALLKSGANIDYQNKRGETPLIVACRQGHLDAVNTLLKEKPLPNLELWTEKPLGYRALHIAAKEGQAAIVRLLIEAGAYVGAAIGGPDGHEVMHLAVEQPNIDRCVETVKVLIDCKVLVEFVNKKGQTALHRAIEIGCDNRVILTLVREGQADIDRKDRKSHSSLYMAAATGKDELVNILWNPENKQKASIFFHAVAEKMETRINQLQCTGYKGPERDEWGRSLLDVAVNPNIRQMVMPNESDRENVVTSLDRNQWCPKWQNTLNDTTCNMFFSCDVCNVHLEGMLFYHCCTCSEECTLKTFNMCAECFKIRNCKEQHKTWMRFLGNNILSIEECSPKIASFRRQAGMSTLV